MLPVEADRVYKLLTARQWEALCASGRFEGSPDDLRDGFIHLSSGSQVAGTLARHYAQVDDLVLIEVDAGSLGAALVHEASRGGALFPHLYAPLRLTACRGIARRERANDEWQLL